MIKLLKSVNDFWNHLWHKVHNEELPGGNSSLLVANNVSTPDESIDLKCIKPINTETIQGENEYNTEDENEKIRNSKYESESYSVKRFFEILIGYFVEKGRIDLSDPGLLDYWKIDEKDDRYKKNHPGKKYYLDGAAATWQDVYDDMLKCNAIMHEG